MKSSPAHWVAARRLCVDEDLWLGLARYRQFVVGRPNVVRQSRYSSSPSDIQSKNVQPNLQLICWHEEQWQITPSPSASSTVYVTAPQ